MSKSSGSWPKHGRHVNNAKKKRATTLQPVARSGRHKDLVAMDCDGFRLPFGGEWEPRLPRKWNPPETGYMTSSKRDGPPSWSILLTELPAAAAAAAVVMMRLSIWTPTLPRIRPVKRGVRLFSGRLCTVSGQNIWLGDKPKEAGDA